MLIRCRRRRRRCRLDPVGFTAEMLQEVHTPFNPKLIPGFRFNPKVIQERREEVEREDPDEVWALATIRPPTVLSLCSICTMNVHVGAPSKWRWVIAQQVKAAMEAFATQLEKKMPPKHAISQPPKSPEITEAMTTTVSPIILVACSRPIQIRARLKIIRNELLKHVGKSESCMVSILRIIFKRTRSTNFSTMRYSKMEPTHLMTVCTGTNADLPA